MPRKRGDCGKKSNAFETESRNSKYDSSKQNARKPAVEWWASLRSPALRLSRAGDRWSAAFVVTASAARAATAHPTADSVVILTKGPPQAHQVDLDVMAILGPAPAGSAVSRAMAIAGLAPADQPCAPNGPADAATLIAGSIES